jgi:ribosomal protein S11
MAKQSAAGRPRRRERKNITSGVAHVNASFNNTMITITDAGNWRCVTCGQSWTTQRLATVAAYEAWAVNRH